MKKYGSLKGLTRELLQDLYLKFNDREIGELYGATDVAVSKMRRRLGIETLTPKDRRVLLNKGIDITDLTDEELISIHNDGITSVAFDFDDQDELILKDVNTAKLLNSIFNSGLDKITIKQEIIFDKYDLGAIACKYSPTGFIDYVSKLPCKRWSDVFKKEVNE